MSTRKERHNKKTKHHRKARSLNGSDHPNNISWVPANKHRAFHLLFGAGEVHEIVGILNNVWLDPAWEVVVQPRMNGQPHNHD